MQQWTVNTSGKNMPWIVTEYGLFERREPTSFNPPDFEKRLARSYMHFAVWSAFASGHASTPLKWCDGLNYGEMFPRGIGPFENSKYPDLGQEMAVVRSFVSTVELGPLSEKLVYTIELPGGGNIRCWALKSPSTIVAWLFDDDFTKTQDQHWGESTRTYTNSIAASKQDHIITFTECTPNKAHTISWYNTWDGGPYYDTDTIQSDGAGNLLVPVGTFAETANSPAEAWDGADCILLIQEAE